MHQGLAGFRATGAELAVPEMLTMLAEAYGKTGSAEKGLMVLTEGLVLGDKKRNVALKRSCIG
jgi:hypothetical protein